ncbi:hypothetical protein C8J57DRAFT_1224968 [Mycena rebaudengoi]|nr:hypothetical protein C8J57DRAFT_1224968 [Mycena rebaudengoi]
MSFTNNNITDNTEFGRDTGRPGGNYNSNSEYAGFGRPEGQLDLAIFLHLPFLLQINLIPPTLLMSMNPSYGGMGQQSDNLSAEAGGFDGSGRQAEGQFVDRGEFNNTSMGGSSSKVPMGEKLIGGVEKLARPVMGNTNIKERGQERKMMGSEEQNF